jgi:hypothetical protein
MLYKEVTQYVEIDCIREVVRSYLGQITDYHKVTLEFSQALMASVGTVP